MQINIGIENIFTIFVNMKRFWNKNIVVFFLQQAMGNLHAMALVALRKDPLLWKGGESDIEYQ